MLTRVLTGAVILTLACAMPALAQDSSNSGPYGQTYIDSQGNPTDAVIGRYGLMGPKEQNNGKVYVSLSGGITIPVDSDLHNSSVSSGSTVGFDVGPLFDAAVGKYVGPFRFEGDLGLRYNDMSSLRLSTGQSVNGHFDGYLESASLMANGYYDIALRSNLIFYVGGGFGLAGEHLHVSTTGTAQTYLPSGGTDWVFAYQLMAGTSLRLSQGVYLNVGYRYWTSLNPEFDGVEIDAPTTHAVEVGVRFDL